MRTDALTKALELTAEKVSPEVQLNTLLTFLFVAAKGTCTQQEVMDYLNTSNAGASRNISYWTERRFDRQPGMGFIERVQDEHDRRYRHVTTTKRGKDFYAALQKAMA